LFGFFKKALADTRVRRLERSLAITSRELADVRAQLEAEERKRSVAEAEIEALAEVVARDRERVRAETAEAARRVADAEGSAK
jgi:hypothetical protein